MIASNILPVAAAGLYLAGAALAEQYWDQDCQYTTCWASFSFECKQGPWDCTFNDTNSYPEFLRKDQEEPRLVLIDKDITIQWRGQDEDHPVRLSWHWWHENDTDPTPEMIGVSQLPSMKWDRNISGDASEITFNIWDIIQEDFPNNNTNLTANEVLARVQNNMTGGMVFGIYQPESPKYEQLQRDWDVEAGHYSLVEFGDYFRLSSYSDQDFNILERYFKAQFTLGERNERSKWGKGVGIGVGVGVPILTVLAMVAGYFYGRKKERAHTGKAHDAVQTTSSGPKLSHDHEGTGN